MRIALIQLNPTIGNMSGNTSKIIKSIEEAKAKKIDLVLFSELILTGYPPDDFLYHVDFLNSIEEHLQKIIKATNGIMAVVGLPRRNPNPIGNPLFNSAAIIQNGVLLGYQDKTLLPNYDVFNERRYFEPSVNQCLWILKGKKIGITICEDIWQETDLLKQTGYHFNPVEILRQKQPDLVLNLSSSPYSSGKKFDRLKVCQKAARSLGCPLLYCNQVGGQDSLIFDGYSLYVNQRGEVLAWGKGFQEDFLEIDLSVTYHPMEISITTLEDLYQALILGLRDYFQKSGFSRACFGLSGGIDSAVVACLASEALGNENILSVAMPSRFSSSESLQDATKLAKNLGIELIQISIEEPYMNFLDILKPQFQDKPFDVTEENMQARIRGIILMALSNKLGYIVLSTGNKSELAMGYATLYGDMCGGLGVLSDVTKNQVYELARWINRHQEIIPNSTLTKPPSAELRPNQKDQDNLPEYEIIDNVVKSYVEEFLPAKKIAEKYHYDLVLVEDLIKRIHRNEYKRRQSPPGLRVSERAFSIGRRFPIVQHWCK